MQGGRAGAVGGEAVGGVSLPQPRHIVIGITLASDPSLRTADSQISRSLLAIACPLLKVAAESQSAR